MTNNIEIEFKTAISESDYYRLLIKLHLDNNVFKQINYYFDTDNFDLRNSKQLVRIRIKQDTFYKVTLKSQKAEKAFENHVNLSKETALEMLKSGFNTSKFFDLDFFVKHKATLLNSRAKTPYQDGVLFLDKCEYNGITDYEIEYEVNDYNDGKKAFFAFLEKEDIFYKETRRKSERAFSNLKIT